ncbi:MAG TPA: alpha/beta fold hydrolase [Polyangiaceae bacterium]|nr:alpha/beta fold hydrolase [Polyangiaceae bacterium]
MTLHACTLADGSVEAECGSLSVPEDESKPEGRMLSLNLAVIEALAARPKADPLVIFAGGPGQAATESGAFIARALSRVRRYRDIVLVDQRGTGKSHALLCPDDGDVALERRFDRELDVNDVRQCLAKLDADPSRYTTPAALADLTRVLDALGYQRVNLWGGSYGTRVALAFAQQFPERTRRMVLDGAAPTDIELPLFVGRDAERALGRLYADCASDPRCHSAFPRGRDSLDQILARLRSGPEQATLTHPRTGQKVTIPIHYEGFVAGLRSLLYVPQMTALLPLMMAQAEQHEWGAFVTAVLTLSDSMGETPIPLGMFLSVVCSEDVVQISDADVVNNTRDNFFGRAWLDDIRRICEFWPKAKLDPHYFEPFTGDTPSLVLSGAEDPVLPPSWGELVAGRLAHAKHVVVPGMGHGVTSVGCIPERIAEFIEGDQDVSELDFECAERVHRPPFFTSAAGPMALGMTK